MSGPGELTVRPARPSDLGWVERIERQSFSDPWPRGALLSELQADAMRMPMVAEKGGQGIGYLMAWRVIDRLHILNLAVCPEERGTGAGSRLLAAALAAARDRNLAEVTLEVRQSNSGARSFYVRHGFLVTGRRPRYYRDTREDAIIMSLALP